MGNDLSWERAALGGVWAETLLYGVYVNLYGLWVYATRSRRRPPTNRRLFVTATAMFLLATTHVVLDFVQVLLTPDALASDAVMDQLTDDAPILRALITWDMFNPVVDAIFVTNQVLADGVLIYRCFAVWGSNYRVIVVPVIFLLATTACGYADVAALAEAYQMRRDWPSSREDDWPPPRWDYLTDLDINLTTALLSTSLATSVIVTTLIGLRIWRTTRQLEISLGHKHKRVFTRAMTIIIESGAIYSTCLMIWIIVNSLTSNAAQIPYNSMCQIVGIVPMLMLLRVTFSRGEYSTSTTTGPSDQHAMSIHFRPGPMGTSAQPTETDAMLTGDPSTPKTVDAREPDVELGRLSGSG